MILEKILERPEVKDKFEMAGLGETDIEFIKALIKGKVPAEASLLLNFNAPHIILAKKRIETV